jgi:hypothetical protein
MSTKILNRSDAMKILGITSAAMSALLEGNCIDEELIARYALLHELVTDRPADLMRFWNPETDIRAKIAKERAARQSRISSKRRDYAARIAGVTR